MDFAYNVWFFKSVFHYFVTILDECNVSNKRFFSFNDEKIVLLPSQSTSQPIFNARLVSVGSTLVQSLASQAIQPGITKILVSTRKICIPYINIARHPN